MLSFDMDRDFAPADVTVPASPRAKRLPPGSRTPVPLAQVRQDVGLLPPDLKSSLLTPERITSLERHEAIDLCALAAYVQALGGHLEIAAVFGVRRYPLDLSEGAASSVRRDAPSDDF